MKDILNIAISALLLSCIIWYVIGMNNVATTASGELLSAMEKVTTNYSLTGCEELIGSTVLGDEVVYWLKNATDYSVKVQTLMASEAGDSPKTLTEILSMGESVTNAESAWYVDPGVEYTAARLQDDSGGTYGIVFEEKR